MQRLYPCLQATGVPHQQVHEWTSHCFRRGSGVDVLEAHGVAAMVAHGGWSDPRAAEPYATADEQHAAGMATSALLVMDLSEDDS